MAAVSLSPLPLTLPVYPMTSRRVPLANNPNAANSPYRVTIGTKRPRSYADDSKDHAYIQSPGKKRQLVDFKNNGAHRSQYTAFEEQEGNVFAGISDRATSTSFTRRLAAVREAKDTHQKDKDKQEHESPTEIETIKQWRRHYKKVFPTFVFYFESIPPDICIRSSRQIAALGAREEKFFSKSVTHIVTTRTIPSDSKTPQLHEARPASSKLVGASVLQLPHARTINPLLLDKSAESHGNLLQQKVRQGLDTTSHRHSQAALEDGDGRRRQGTSNDVLCKAQEMGMKVWALEKFERMMTTMFNPELADDLEEKATSRMVTAGFLPNKPTKNSDLSQLIRNEKLNSTAERAPWQDIIPFTGYFIYVHDMDEKTKPVMIREYEKPDHTEDGEWPMLRSLPSGRCPFVEETRHYKNKDNEGENKKTKPQSRETERLPPVAKTKSSLTDVERAKNRPFHDPCQGTVLKENRNLATRPPTMAAPLARVNEPPKPDRRGSGLENMPPPNPEGSHTNFRGIAQNFGGEPIASGVQPSNVTSAIQSQMVSSTAAAPGLRRGISREITHLQRRVLQNNSGLSACSMPSSRINDLRAAINNNSQAPAPGRTTRRKAAEVMARIHEDEPECNEEDRNLGVQEGTSSGRKDLKKDQKPGYCENCREKYDDFDEHVSTRKHRKFALSSENWLELDRLIAKLARR